MSKCAAALLVVLGLGSFAQAGDPPVVRSAASGVWSAPATWQGGKIPAAGTKVYIAPGHRVVYDLNSDQVIRSIHLDGILTFAHDKNTRLDVGLIRVQANGSTDEEGFDCKGHLPGLRESQARGALLVGTPNQPIDPKHTALIRLNYIDGMDKESCPAIVCCGGRMEFHGAIFNRTWVRLGENAKTGDSGVTLIEAVTGWKPGDRVIITATQRSYGKGTSVTEERIIKEIAGTKIVLDTPLANDHLGSGDFRGEVANLSRNVTVESAPPLAPPSKGGEQNGSPPSEGGRRGGGSAATRCITKTLRARSATPSSDILANPACWEDTACTITSSAIRCAAAMSSAPRFGTAAIAG